MKLSRMGYCCMFANVVNTHTIFRLVKRMGSCAI